MRQNIQNIGNGIPQDIAETPVDLCDVPAGEYPGDPDCGLVKGRRQPFSALAQIALNLLPEE